MHEHSPTRQPGLGGFAIFTAKPGITCAYFVYLERSVDVAVVVRAVRKLDIWWGLLAALLLNVQIPLVGLRLSWILNAPDRKQLSARLSIIAIAITTIADFFPQVMPSFAAETVRAWMLVEPGHSWRQ